MYSIDLMFNCDSVKRFKFTKCSLKKKKKLHQQIQTKPSEF